LTYLAVHFSLRGSRLSFRRFFLHLLEHVHWSEPSFFTSSVPCPVVTGLPQKKQLRVDMVDLLISVPTIFAGCLATSLYLSSLSFCFS
jgi:hypothetical protein